LVYHFFFHPWLFFNGWLFFDGQLFFHTHPLLLLSSSALWLKFSGQVFCNIIAIGQALVPTISLAPLGQFVLLLHHFSCHPNLICRQSISVHQPPKSLRSGS
jgi:hypothetical protein